MILPQVVHLCLYSWKDEDDFMLHVSQILGHCFFFSFHWFMQATVKSEQSIRKAGENVDDTQWKDTIQLQKDEEEFFPGTRVSPVSLLLVVSCSL